MELIPHIVMFFITIFAVYLQYYFKFKETYNHIKLARKDYQKMQEEIKTLKEYVKKLIEKIEKDK